MLILTETISMYHLIRKKIISISIEDDGPGINKKDYDKAVKPFIRLDSSRNQNIPGSGLGLSITRYNKQSRWKLIVSKTIGLKYN